MSNERADGIPMWVWMDGSGNDAVSFERPADVRAVEVWAPMPDRAGAIAGVITMALRNACDPRQRPRRYCVDAWLWVEDGLTAVSFDPIPDSPALSVRLPDDTSLLQELRAVFLARIARSLPWEPVKIDRRDQGLPSNSSSIRAFPGGLPGLGKRR
ncbi:hypothetical protein [Streptomyces xantholiticus]|uniref:Uncharacterized protein n=1 Tax=Streptomyces xantholiticus TaxID=68285 RepID=A0ABV1UZS3_9ACTN